MKVKIWVITFFISLAIGVLFVITSSPILNSKDIKYSERLKFKISNYTSSRGGFYLMSDNLDECYVISDEKYYLNGKEEPLTRIVSRGMYFDKRINTNTILFYNQKDTIQINLRIGKLRNKEKIVF